MIALLLTAEHVHVMLNHLPIIGVMAAIVPLALGLIWRDRRVQISGLILVGLMALSIPIVMESGEGADHNIENGVAPGASFDATAEYWLEEHEERAETTAIVDYILIAVAVAGLIAALKFPKALTPITGVALALAVVGSGLAAWTAEAGGKIRHPEFREGTATALTEPLVPGLPAIPATSQLDHDDDGDEAPHLEH